MLTLMTNFRVRSKNSNFRFPMTSYEISSRIHFIGKYKNKANSNF